jgi:CheY-like chemotaxis protein
MVQQMIQLKGGTSYQCIEADSGQQALEIVSEELKQSQLLQRSEMPQRGITTEKAVGGGGISAAAADLTALEEGRRREAQVRGKGSIVEASGPSVSATTQRADRTAEWPFAAILVDYEMPGGLSGPETVRRLRQQLGYGGLVLGVTGHQSTSVRNEFLSAGADSVITKPLKFDVLVLLIRQHQYQSEGLISVAKKDSASEIP